MKNKTYMDMKRFSLFALSAMFCLRSCMGEKDNAFEESMTRSLGVISEGHSMIENDSENWLSNVDTFQNYVNDLYQKDGHYKSYMRVILEEGMLVIHREKHGPMETREEVTIELIKMIDTITAFKDCAEHGYTFLFEAVDEDDNITYSYKFTPEDYNK